MVFATDSRQGDLENDERESQLRTLFNSMDEGFSIIELIFDTVGRAIDYRFLDVNPAFEKQTTLHDVVGKTIRELDPAHGAFWFEIFGEVALSGNSTHFVTESTAFGDRWFEVSAFRLGEAQGAKVAVLLNDISERKHLEDELRVLAATLSEADRRKNQFLATLAHELRNPLAPIRNGLQVMKLAKDDKQIVEQTRGMMERQIGHMVRLVDDLLDSSRISRGKVQLRKELVSLADVIQQAVETSRPAIDAGGHQLTLHLPAEPIFVVADTTRMSQVLSNILNNSAKYCDGSGPIALTVLVNGNDAEIRVKDSGIGIPHEMLPKVFDLFTQVDQTLEKSQGGLGIGLSLVKAIVEMHEGTVEAISAGPGLGSEFVIRIPVVRPHSESTSEDRPDVSTRPKPCRILIADDNRDSALSLALMLKMLGNETQTAHDGLEALSVADVFRPDVVLLDIGMPKLNGYETARKLRALSWGAALKLVALTGWGQDSDRVRSREAGFDRHLVKPVDPAALQKLLSALCVE